MQFETFYFLLFLRKDFARTKNTKRTKSTKRKNRTKKTKTQISE